ncbi:MAG: hypothetical protein MJ231_03055, partial [bacterium]|nr:hypothetical protein [bacterium]
MKILRIDTNNINKTSFLQQTASNNVSDNNKKWNNNIAKAVAGLCILSAGGIIIHKYIKTKSTSKDILTNALSEADKDFHKSIAESLKKCGIEVTSDSLKSIVAPDEFSSLIKKFKPEHFNASLQISEARAANKSLEEFYKNAIDGNFRVSLHTHSNFSDGKATVEEFLDCATKYADKVASMGKNDGLPPLTIALTDHDSVKGCQEIIKLIAKNPEKYKNLKFVSGCEFSVRSGSSHHDITGLALNPFDEKLNKKLSDLSDARKNVVNNFLEKQYEFNGKKISYEDLAEYEKNYYKSRGKGGKHSIENGSGIVSVRHAIKFFYKMTNQPIDKNMVNILGDKEILPIEQVVNTIKQNGGYASLTHPIKSFWRYIGDEELIRLKNIGVTGIEVNHQYSPSKITKLGEINNDINNADNIFKEITEKYKAFADKN